MAGRRQEIHGEFPDQIDLAMLLASGGGFDVGFGRALDPAKVEALKNRPDLNQ